MNFPTLMHVLIETIALVSLSLIVITGVYSLIYFIQLEQYPGAVLIFFPVCWLVQYWLKTIKQQPLP